MDSLEDFIKEKFAEQARRIEEEIRKDPYALLNEEDRRALELGRKILAESQESSEENG